MATKEEVEPLSNFIIKHFFKMLFLIAFLFLIHYIYGAISIFNIYRFGVALLPYVGLILLLRIAWTFWLHYIRQDFISGITWTLLEIIPPREVERSPLAMELFITNALYHHSNKGGKEAYWQGAVWLWFSLEIVSIEGQVHFYIRTPSRIRSLIETQMYAQYPQAQIREVEDYTLAVDEISPRSSWMGWGCEFGLLKHEAYPIKTYVDFGLDDNPKEEYKIDPISPVVEFLGSLGKGEQAWIQVIVTPSKKMWHTPGTWFGKHDWVEESQHEIERMLQPYTRVHAGGGVGGTDAKETRAPDFYRDTIEAMTNKTDKLGFETGIRLMYVAKKEAYNMSNRRNVRLLFRQYANPDNNQFDRVNGTAADAYSGLVPSSPETVMVLANRMLHEFRERAFFHPPMRHHIFSKSLWNWPIPGVLTISALIRAYDHHHTFVLNTEEIATLWHFPGQILKVPTLTRIESKEASPPPNLPI